MSDPDDRRERDAGAAAADLMDALPTGWSTVMVDGRRWGVTITTHGDGASRSLQARELAGSAVVGANLYTTSSGPVLRPCDVSSDTVVAFLRSATPVPPRDDGQVYMVALDLPSWVPTRVANLATEWVHRARSWWHRDGFRKRGRRPGPH